MALDQGLYELKSVVVRLELRELFAFDQPLEIELGSGDGSFLVAFAQKHPDRNFIGVERLLGRIRKMERRARSAAATNLRGVRIESTYFLEHLLPPRSASALHIYFPDPWPKRRHRHHRLVKEGFPELAQKVLKSGGGVFLRTDDLNYFQEMQSVFETSAHFRPVNTPDDLKDTSTDFEMEFRARGLATYHAAYALAG